MDPFLYSRKDDTMFMIRDAPTQVVNLMLTSETLASYYSCWTHILISHSSEYQSFSLIGRVQISLRHCLYKSICVDYLTSFRFIIVGKLAGI